MRFTRVLICIGMLCVPNISRAAVVDVTVRFENLAPTNSISFAPLRVGFNNGTFDSFDINTAATAPIISVAEGGSGSDWFPAFMSADPTSVLGTVAAGGPFLPGGSGSATFRVDTNVNQFFTFAGMVIPSNDLFIGNDNPQGFRILDGAGNLLINQINQSAASIWDAGSEQAIAANAAFLQGSNNDDRVAQNGVVTFAFSELNAYDGLTTAAGYVFDADLITSDTAIARISFSVSAVPEPSSAALLGVFAFGAVLRRKRA